MVTLWVGLTDGTGEEWDVDEWWIDKGVVCLVGMENTSYFPLDKILVIRHKSGFG
jgi:hypothetical protein